MTQQLLHGADVVTTFEQVGGEGMAQGMRRCRLVHAGVAHCLLERALYRLILKMMAAGLPGTRINR